MLSQRFSVTQASLSTIIPCMKFKSRKSGTTRTRSKVLHFAFPPCPLRSSRGRRWLRASSHLAACHTKCHFCRKCVSASTCSVLILWSSKYKQSCSDKSSPVIPGFDHFFRFTPLNHCHRRGVIVLIIKYPFRICDPEHATNFELMRFC